MEPEKLLFSVSFDKNGKTYGMDTVLTDAQWENNLSYVSDNMEQIVSIMKKV